MDLLNDDCLYNIFQYLSLEDQMAVSGASKRFGCVLDIIWRAKYKNRLELKLSTKMQTRLEGVKVFISHVNQYVQHVQLESETIDLVNELSPFQFYKTHKLYVSVESTQLLQDKFVAKLHGIFPNVKILQPAGKFTGAGFTMWKSIEELTLSSCFTFQFEYLEEILQELPIHTLILKSFKAKLPRLGTNALQYCALRTLVLNSYELPYFTPNLHNLVNLKNLQISDLYSSSNLDTLHNKLVELHNILRIEAISTREFIAIFPKIIDLHLHTRLRRLLLATDPIAISAMLRYIQQIPSLRVLHFHTCYVRSAAEFLKLLSLSSHLDEIGFESCIFSCSSLFLDVEAFVKKRTKLLVLNFFENKSEKGIKINLELKEQHDLLKVEREQKLFRGCHYLAFQFT
ncbi:uncharacterized protein LOC128861937 isoform X1 [Anastrepha ludens]|uniref:uncharacterized protein LOC128861937 isoform X1 n=1 Tax=Anastrepha ludens TaxID=28586 RepID=UPI0023B1713D|nr:uncharacterized protein LOC128861937 isoform X1 [Anastrepha ludens]